MAVPSESTSLFVFPRRVGDFALGRYGGVGRGLPLGSERFLLRDALVVFLPQLGFGLGEELRLAGMAGEGLLRLAQLSLIALNRFRGSGSPGSGCGRADEPPDW
jgi:hypothetical protein